MAWRTIERPGHFGKRKGEIHKQNDEKYGKENWRIAWQGVNEIIPYLTACQIYEEGYYLDSFNREGLWKELMAVAKNVYDHQESDVESGLEYLVQKGAATHLQDIAIRRVVLRRGWRFEGDQLIQIRSHDQYWGKNLSPGKVPFHLPELIVVPSLQGWWEYNSIEDFYQSNKVLQVREGFP